MNPPGAPGPFEFDVFVCHSSDDKKEIVRPLVDALRAAGFAPWYDEAGIAWGDSIPEQIDRGLARSRYVLVVLSASFAAKSYAQGELRATLHRQLSTGEKRILPLLVGGLDVLAPFPLLADLRGLPWEGEPAPIVDELRRRVARDGAGPRGSSAKARRAIGRVAVFSSEFPPRIHGGLGVHVARLTHELAAHVDVDVLLPTNAGGEYRAGAPRLKVLELAQAEASYSEPTSWLRYGLRAAERLTRHAETARPDILHCHDWVTALAGLKCRWELGIPLVFHLHLPNRSRLCASIENLGLLGADLITVNSEAMHADLGDRALPLRGAVEVIDNGVDRALFHPLSETDDAVAEGDFILFVGRLVEQKGVATLLRAFAYVVEKFPRVRLAIAGDGELRPALENLAANRLLTDRIDFLGWVQGAELAPLYQRALAVAVPSLYEPFGMTALEALACGRPVVASRVGGLKEIIRHGETGYLFDSSDELDLAQWLMALLAERERRRSLGAAGLAFASAPRFDWSQIALCFLDRYAALTGRVLDRRLPPIAHTYRDQAIQVAGEIHPQFADPNHPLLTALFAWMDDA